MKDLSSLILKVIYDAKKKVKIRLKCIRTGGNQRSRLEVFYIKGIKEKLFQSMTPMPGLHTISPNDKQQPINFFKKIFYIPILFEEQIYLAKVKLQNIEKIYMREGGQLQNSNQDDQDADEKEKEEQQCGADAATNVAEKLFILDIVRVDYNDLKQKNS